MGIDMDLPQDYRKLSIEERRSARAQYCVEQNGKCSHCQESLSGDPASRVMRDPIDKSLFPKGMFSFPIHLHHDHKTGMTIGSVHARCNAWLWQYKGE